MPNQLFEMTDSEISQPTGPTQPNEDMSLPDTIHPIAPPVAEMNATDRNRNHPKLNSRMNHCIVDEDSDDDVEEFRARLNRDVEVRIRDIQKQLRRHFRNKPDIHAVVNAVLRTAPIDLNAIAQDIQDGFRLRQ